MGKWSRGIIVNSVQSCVVWHNLVPSLLLWFRFHFLPAFCLQMWRLCSISGGWLYMRVIWLRAYMESARALLHIIGLCTRPLVCRDCIQSFLNGVYETASRHCQTTWSHVRAVDCSFRSFARLHIRIRRRAIVRVHWCACNPIRWPWPPPYIRMNPAWWCLSEFRFPLFGYEWHWFS